LVGDRPIAAILPVFVAIQFRFRQFVWDNLSV